MCSLVANPARGQTAGFAADRFEPAERGSEWFAGESLDLRGDGRWAAGGTFDYAHEPLVAYDGDEVQAKLIERQLFLHLGAALLLSDTYRLGISAPVLLDSAGETVDIGGQTYSPPNGAALGDIRLGFDIRLLGEFGDPATLAFGAWGYIPNGSTSEFAGDGSTRIQPRLAFAGRTGGFEYAAKTGVNIRTKSTNFAGEPFGTEWQFALAAGARLLDDKLLVGPELWGSTVLTDSGTFDREATPLEAVVGGHYRFDDVMVGLGVGPGITRGLGTPTMRALLSVEYAPEYQSPYEPQPEPEVGDSDGDGILDDIDACPTAPGPASDDLKAHGCPRPDADEDGIYDTEDACVDTPGVNTEDPETNGCPLPGDRDNDGFIDEEDACPDEAGVDSNDPSKRGCPPPPDSDGDGILDPQDACPSEPGPARSPAEKNGCPLAQVTADRVEILERIEFDSGKATLRSESDPVLEAVQQILEGHPEITLLSVEGHTDNRGNANFNRRLSKDRARAVVDWLVARGVDESRLTSMGFGPDQPLQTNDTEEGRQNNRRVEFKIKRRDASKGNQK